MSSIICVIFPVQIFSHRYFTENKEFIASNPADYIVCPEKLSAFCIACDNRIPEHMAEYVVYQLEII